MDGLAFRNALQLHFAQQLENLIDYNEEQRFHSQDDPFCLSEHFIKIFV